MNRASHMIVDCNESDIPGVVFFGIRSVTIDGRSLIPTALESFLKLPRGVVGIPTHYSARDGVVLVWPKPSVDMFADIIYRGDKNTVLSPPVGWMAMYEIEFNRAKEHA